MKKHPAFAEVSVAEKPAGKGKLTGLTVDVAANGFVVREHRESTPGPWREPKSTVFEGKDALLAHLSKTLK